MKRPEVVEQIKQQLQHVSPDAIVFLFILPKNQWENRPLITPFYLNIINEGVRL